MSTGAARSSSAVDPKYQAILEQYAAGMKFYSQQKFDKAKPHLEKVCEGPYRELAERARVHLHACNNRLAAVDGKPQSGPDLYQAAIVKLNAAQYQDAEDLLVKALQRGFKGPDVSYALACLHAQTNNGEAALVHLQEAIQADGFCRVLAQQDHDFDGLMEDPRFTEILYPESKA